MSHPENATVFLKDKSRAKWHDDTLWIVREKRDATIHQIPEWEELRELASQIKDHTLSKLDYYLEELEKNASANGIKVHWAENAAEHNEIISKILEEKNCKTVVKSKSILTEECHLNPFLEERGIEVVDTDLGERIIQFLKQPPSHIVMPALPWKKSDISDIFHEKLHTEKGNIYTVYLTHVARLPLREKFIM